MTSEGEHIGGIRFDGTVGDAHGVQIQSTKGTAFTREQVLADAKEFNANYLPYRVRADAIIKSQTKKLQAIQALIDKYNERDKKILWVHLIEAKFVIADIEKILREDKT